MITSLSPLLTLKFFLLQLQIWLRQIIYQVLVPHHKTISLPFLMQISRVKQNIWLNLTKQWKPVHCLDSGHVQRLQARIQNKLTPVTWAEKFSNIGPPETIFCQHAHLSWRLVKYTLSWRTKTKGSKCSRTELATRW